jgi:hypothetical protein
MPAKKPVKVNPPKGMRVSAGVEAEKLPHVVIAHSKPE